MRAGFVALACAMWALTIGVPVWADPPDHVRADQEEPQSSQTVEQPAQTPTSDPNAIPAAPADEAKSDPDAVTGAGAPPTPDGDPDSAEPDPAAPADVDSADGADSRRWDSKRGDAPPDEESDEDWGRGERDDWDGKDSGWDRDERRSERDEQDEDEGKDEEPDRTWGGWHEWKRADGPGTEHDADRAGSTADEELSESLGSQSLTGGDESIAGGPSAGSGNQSASGDGSSDPTSGDGAVPGPLAFAPTPVVAPAPVPTAPADDTPPAPAGGGPEPRAVGGAAQRPSAVAPAGDGSGDTPEPDLLAATGAGSGGSTAGTGGGSAASGGTGSEPSDGGARSGGDGGPSGEPSAGGSSEGPGAGSPVVRTVRDIVEVVPESLKLGLAALALLSLLLAGAYVASALRARSLARQRSQLLRDVGLLQAALLPPLPDKIGALHASVAYRPADGPGAGGDFYDALALSGNRAAFVIGDVSGHGHGALERTAVLRYTVRAYLEAGLDPRMALQVAGQALDERLGSDFATVLVAVHDPASGALTYASAGHPHPIVTGSGVPFEPVLAGSAPPIGAGERTGLRQTRVPLTPGGVACLHTDGVTEARTPDGLLGSDRLAEIVTELGTGASASDVIDRVRASATSLPDDVAVCLLSPSSPVTVGGLRTEELELSAAETDGPLPARFLAACGVAPAAATSARHELRATAHRYDGAILTVTFGSRPVVEIHPRNIETIQAAATRTAAAGSSRRTARR